MNRCRHCGRPLTREERDYCLPCRRLATQPGPRHSTSNPWAGASRMSSPAGFLHLEKRLMVGWGRATRHPHVNTAERSAA